MKVKLAKVHAEGLEIEGLEIEGNMAEYLKVASSVQTNSVSNLQRILSTLVETSTKARAEAKEWSRTILDINDQHE